MSTSLWLELLIIRNKTWGLLIYEIRLYLDLLLLRLLYLRPTEGGGFKEEVNLGASSISISMSLSLSLFLPLSLTLGGGDIDLDLDLDLDLDRDLDLDLWPWNLLSFIFLAFCLALKNSKRPSFSQPSLIVKKKMLIYNFYVFKESLNSMFRFSQHFKISLTHCSIISSLLGT